ncbi:DDT-RELATED PROTEIN1 [Hibiscus trionum]|uniref:DDT-RELATED PROTEIN1 n=1 Tax=Hibiscus trionum TaxID=183268 RepID=A0A9W7MJ82_HIBTR|nr:DDT-RELATED PROTEIN1 [Hibiscus trionum]
MKKSNNTNTETDRQTDSKLSTKSRRNSSPGVRLIHNRIYDSQNGKTCHQCRQKTVDFAASCKRKINEKQCTSHFCHKCLLNRYGEKAEEVALLNDWNCPRCRGICNCSFCMKKRGHQPTGRLVHAAKANGFASVSDMLHLKDSERSGSQETVDEAVPSRKRKAADNKSSIEETDNSRKESSDKGSNGSIQVNDKNAATSNTKLKRLRSKNSEETVSEGNGADFSTQKTTPKKSKISDEALFEGEVISDRDTAIQLIDMKVPRKCDQGEDEMLNNADPIAKNKPTNKSPNPKKKIVEVKSEVSDDDIVLPQGTLLNCVDGIDLTAEDVGNALQFLEFCEAFGEVLNMKKGQSQLLLRELFTGKSRRKHKLRYPSIVQFHIQLLSMLQKDLGKEYPCLSRDLSENSWVQVLGEYISDSQKPLKQPLLDCLDMGDDRNEKLNSSKKLRLLNFLCDEALGTTEFRSWIDEQNSKFIEKEKKAKEKLLSRRERERNMEKEMKKKLQDEIAKAIIMKNGAPLSISENEELISRIKKEVAQTLEVAYTLAVIPKEEEDCRLDAVRSEPICWDGHGHKFLKFWRLRGHSDETDILLQDIEVGDSVAAKEGWYTYSTEQKATVEKYISSFRMQRK